jgi:hypothetical protein
MTNQMPPVWPFTFGILSSYFEDINPANNASTVILRRGDFGPVAVPSLSPSALLPLIIGLATTAYWSSRQSQRGHPETL